MANLSSAIIEARKRHEAEIAERLKRRQARQRAELERLNRAAEPTSAPVVVPSAPQPEAAPPVAAHEVRSVPERAATAPPDPPVPAKTVEAEQSTPAPEPAASTSAEPVVATPAPPEVDELETPPDGRFLRLRNDIIDRIKPFLTGNQFAVYMEIYRQTIGRGKTAGWFRTRDVQVACNLGSDNTVRDAYPVLERKRLIKLDPNRRVGSPKGLFITVLSVERALERLERTTGTVSRSTLYVAPAAERSVQATAIQADPDAGPSPAALVQTMVRTYGVTPAAAPHMLEHVPPQDLALLPYLFRRLDRNISAGKVHNPAGLLRVWLESFDAWRPELEAERKLDEDARRLAATTVSRDELLVAWFQETERHVEKLYKALDADERAAIEARGRSELAAKSPAVRTWSPAQWTAQLEIFVKSELRRRLDSFDDWLARRQGT